MKLFWIPNPWDYHRSAGYFVVARDQESALKKLHKLVDAENAKWNDDPDDDYDYARTSKIEWDKIREMVGGIASTGGCDD